MFWALTDHTAGTVMMYCCVDRLMTESSLNVVLIFSSVCFLSSVRYSVTRFSTSAISFGGMAIVEYFFLRPSREAKSESCSSLNHSYLVCMKLISWPHFHSPLLSTWRTLPFTSVLSKACGQLITHVGTCSWVSPVFQVLMTLMSGSWPDWFYHAILSEATIKWLQIQLTPRVWVQATAE